MESTQLPPPDDTPARAPTSPGWPVDVVVGASALAARAAATVVRRARPVAEPLARAALDPAIAPEPLRPGHWLRALANRGRQQRGASREEAARILDVLVPAVLETVLRRADLTALVKKYVDLDTLVASVDLDAAAKRIDVNAIAGEVDLDAAASRVDVNAVARRVDVDVVLDRIDLTALVLDRVDLDAVARGLDVDAVLDRIDLTAVVLNRVDLAVLVQAVLDQVDLPKIAEDVIDAVDLPEIIRESTGSMASDTVVGARMQGIAADEAVGRLRDRLLLRRGHGHGADPPPDAGGPASPAGGPPSVPTQPAPGG